MLKSTYVFTYEKFNAEEPGAGASAVLYQPLGSILKHLID